MTDGTGADPPPVGSNRRVEIDKDAVRRDLMKLVLTIVELLRQLMERQAIRRVDQGDLTEAEEEDLGTSLLLLQDAMGRADRAVRSHRRGPEHRPRAPRAPAAPPALIRPPPTAPHEEADLHDRSHPTDTPADAAPAGACAGPGCAGATTHLHPPGPRVPVRRSSTARPTSSTG